jgi:hypothetical protein
MRFPKRVAVFGLAGLTLVSMRVAGFVIYYGSSGETRGVYATA